MPRPAPRKPAISACASGPHHSAIPDKDPNHPGAQMLLWAYAHAIFPMVDPASDVIEWFHPDPRGIIPLDPPEAFRIPKTLAREVRKRRFTIRSDTAFERIMRECATARSDDNQSWMNERLLQAYVQLFFLGHAHSVEAWLDDALVGGLYGVHLGGAFFGESMFSRPETGGSNASKVCLVHLVQWLRRRGFMLLDTQFANQHLLQFGCVGIPATEYHARLQQAILAPVSWGQFTAQ